VRVDEAVCVCACVRACDNMHMSCTCACACDDLQRVSSAALGYDQPVEIKPMAEGDDPSPVRERLDSAWVTNLGAHVAGCVGPQGAVAGGHALRPTPSETLVRTGLLDRVLWATADARQWQQLQSRGEMTALNPADGGPRVEVARLWRENRLLRATRCRLRAIRWAQRSGVGGRWSGGHD